MDCLSLFREAQVLFQHRVVEKCRVRGWGDLDSLLLHLGHWLHPGPPSLLLLEQVLVMELRVLVMLPVGSTHLSRTLAQFRAALLPESLHVLDDRLLDRLVLRPDLVHLVVEPDLLRQALLSQKG